MRVQVKICGIRTPEALVACLSAGADYAGFVFYPASPRAVTPETAAALAARGPHLKRVGLFVDADDMLVAAAVEAGRLDALQLQGAESPARVAALQARFGLPVWRAVGVRSEADVREAARTFAGADRLLLDARAPAGSALPGGNGLRFDWSIVERHAPAMPWGLAGGLSADNVGEALRRTGTPLVDVSSGVEDAPGQKNLAKIAAFIEAARRG